MKVRAVVSVAILCLVTVPLSAAPPPDAAFITMEGSGIAIDAVHAVISTCDEIGGHAYHVMPVHLPGPDRELSGCCLIASVPPGQEASIEVMPFVTGLYREGETILTLPLGEEAELAAGAWLNLIDEVITPPPPELEPFPDDALTVPEGEEESGASKEADAPIDLLPPGQYQTSEFMIGNVAIGVVLPESTGSGENWWNSDPLYPGQNRQQLVYNQIVSGANWWGTQGQTAGANLTFFYDLQFSISTVYEPITVSAAGNGETAWVGDVLTTMGFSGATAFLQCYAYDNWMRSTYLTDWAYAVFVADSLNDADGMFPSLNSAFAYLYGPYQVMTYDNGTTGGQWTLARMNQVFAHESGHIFGAPDEYAGAGTCTCSNYGYLGVYNGNCVNCIPPGTQATCVMASNTLQLCSWTPGHVGWRDTDGDTILDPVDGGYTFNPCYLDYGPIPPFWGSGWITGHGTVQVNPWPSPTRTPVSINRITQVVYIIDANPPVPTVPRDGAFDTDVESFDFTDPAWWPDGPHMAAIMAGDNWSIGVSFAVSPPLNITIDTTPPPMPPPMAMIVEAPYSSNPTKATVNWATPPPDPESGIAGHQVDLWQMNPPLPLPIASQFVSDIPIPQVMWQFLGLGMLHAAQYQAVVSPMNGAGVLGASAVSPTLTIDLTPPGPSPQVNDSGAGTDQYDRLSFNWLAAPEDVSPIADYYLLIRDDLSNVIWGGWLGSSSTSYTATGLALALGTKYTGQVRAKNAAGAIGPLSAASDGIMAVTFYPSIGLVKTTAGLGTPVGVRSVYTTSSGTNQPGVVYAQQLDPTAGIRTDSTDSIALGSKIEIAGIVQPNATGELELWNSEAAAEGGSATIGPLGMSNRSLGGGTLGLQPGVINGAGTNNIGLHVLVWGNVTYVSPGPPYYFVVDDGSGVTEQGGLNGVGVRCGTVTPPTPPAFVKVRGVCSFENGYPVVLIRQSGDWW